MTRLLRGRNAVRAVLALACADVLAMPAAVAGGHKVVVTAAALGGCAAAMALLLPGGLFPGLMLAVASVEYFASTVVTHRVSLPVLAGECLAMLVVHQLFALLATMPPGCVLDRSLAAVAVRRVVAPAALTLPALAVVALDVGPVRPGEVIWLAGAVVAVVVLWLSSRRFLGP